MTEGRPRLVFVGYEFDDQAAFEAESRGYLSHVQAELPDGSRYPLLFYDPGRLQQDLDEEVATGNCFIAEPGMIVIPSVTLQNMQNAVSRLYLDGYFSAFEQIEGGAPRVGWRTGSTPDIERGLP